MTQIRIKYLKTTAKICVSSKLTIDRESISYKVVK